MNVQASPAPGNNGNILQNMSENKEKGDTPHELPVVRQSQVKTEETYTGQRNTF